MVIYFEHCLITIYKSSNHQNHTLTADLLDELKLLPSLSKKKMSLLNIPLCPQLFYMCSHCQPEF